jgi:hypothetical protein
MIGAFCAGRMLELGRPIIVATTTRPDTFTFEIVSLVDLCKKVHDIRCQIHKGRGYRTHGLTKSLWESRDLGVYWLSIPPLCQGIGVFRASSLGCFVNLPGVPDVRPREPFAVSVTLFRKSPCCNRYCPVFVFPRHGRDVKGRKYVATFCPCFRTDLEKNLIRSAPRLQDQDQSCYLSDLPRLFPVHHPLSDGH